MGKLDINAMLELVRQRCVSSDAHYSGKERETTFLGSAHPIPPKGLLSGLRRMTKKLEIRWGSLEPPDFLAGIRKCVGIGPSYFSEDACQLDLKYSLLTKCWEMIKNQGAESTP